jgi:hypothetical protein
VTTREPYKQYTFSSSKSNHNRTPARVQAPKPPHRFRSIAAGRGVAPRYPKIGNNVRLLSVLRIGIGSSATRWAAVPHTAERSPMEGCRERAGGGSEALGGGAAHPLLRIISGPNAWLWEGMS